jgi:6-phosphofructokinase 1
MPKRIAVVRCGLHEDIEVQAIRRGYDGLLAGDFEPMDSKAVSGILGRGGSFIGCARCPEMLEPDGPKRAVRMLERHRIDGLIAIGGDGTFRGAQSIDALGVPVIGLTGTIDNDIPGLDRTIGFDTACDTLAWCLNRLRDTAESHNRTFVIEAMGRNSGWLALYAGIAAGADVILVPEVPWTKEEVLEKLLERVEEGRVFHLIVLAEGAGRATDLTGWLNEKTPESLEVRACIPGHIQRGGAPTTVDRILATRCGCQAIEAVLDGRHGMVVGQHRGVIVEIPLEQAVSATRTIDLELYKLALTVA